MKVGRARNQSLIRVGFRFVQVLRGAASAGWAPKAAGGGCAVVNLRPSWRGSPSRPQRLRALGGLAREDESALDHCSRERR